MYTSKRGKCKTLNYAECLFFFFERKTRGDFSSLSSLVFGTTRASDTSHTHSILLESAQNTMSNNNTNTIEETERLLHPETRALLSSIKHTTTKASQHYRERTTTTTTNTKTKIFPILRNFVLGGIGVATVALGSYVSGYRSSITVGNDNATTTMRMLGNEQQQQSKKVVLHTGCSPVAQV